jgi:hypothetical protein
MSEAGEKRANAAPNPPRGRSKLARLLVQLPISARLWLSHTRSAAPRVLQCESQHIHSGSALPVERASLVSPSPHLALASSALLSNTDRISLACCPPAPRRGTTQRNCLHRSSCSLLLLLRRRRNWEPLLPPVVQLCRPHPRLLAQFSLAVRQGEKPAKRDTHTPDQRAESPRGPPKANSGGTETHLAAVIRKSRSSCVIASPP